MQNNLILQKSAKIAGTAGIALMFTYAGVLIFELFARRLGASGLEAVLAVAASVGMVLGLTLVAMTSPKNSVRGLCALYLFAWLLITLALVSLEATARGGLFDVPDSLTAIGRVVAAFLAALALIPSITIPLISRNPDHYPSPAAAASGYIGFVAKAVAIAASIFAAAYFGLSRGMPAEVAILCGFMIESAFLWSYFSLTKSAQRRDRFDMALWAFATAVFGAFIALISIETLSTLTRIDVPFLRPLAQTGETLFISAVGLSVMLTLVTHILTSLIDMPISMSGQKPPGQEKPLSWHIANSIIGARKGIASIRAALTQPVSAPMLSAPDTLPIAPDDMDDADDVDDRAMGAMGAMGGMRGVDDVRDMGDMGDIDDIDDMGDMGDIGDMDDMGDIGDMGDRGLGRNGNAAEDRLRPKADGFPHAIAAERMRDLPGSRAAERNAGR